MLIPETKALHTLARGHKYNKKVKNQPQKGQITKAQCFGPKQT
jgi:uncharacterized protein YjhX (UPF0386 family)